jgi:SAM-dependent methyltransferase
MTNTSLEALFWFLNTYPLKPGARIADFGGTDNIGSKMVTDMLAKGIKKANRQPKLNYHTLDLDSNVDLRKPVADQYPGGKFDTGICMDLMEHTANPFLVAQNIRSSLKKGAYLFVTAPFNWGIHYFPKDYWRFTPQGMEELFSGEGDENAMHIEALSLMSDPVPGSTEMFTRTVAVFRNVKKGKIIRDEESGFVVPIGWDVGSA